MICSLLMEKNTQVLMVQEQRTILIMHGECREMHIRSLERLFMKGIQMGSRYHIGSILQIRFVLRRV